MRSVAGTPAMSVPLASSASGLPIGSQFAARAGGEDLLFWNGPWLNGFSRSSR
nr:amidase family protein [Xylophilus sp. ASV27]